ncbi:MAG TPA: glycosyltransferase, partial [Dermatophilaceae bacterium]|nr:glycosyltransferase [Dermatophilaceae bacterium]
MTLATPLAPVPAATAAASAVHAVVLTGPTADGLDRLLDALAASHPRPHAVLVLDRTGGPHVASLLEERRSGTVALPSRLVPADPRASARRALTAVLTVPDGPGAGVADDDLLWLLPAGVAPEPDALAELLRAARRSPSVAVVGPKVLAAEAPSRLRGAGISATRAGRVLADPADGTPDQGQYDARRDVLAVPAAGALVQAGLLRTLGGWEPTFGDLGGDLDLGWRAHAAGRRVVMAPAARVLADAGCAAATATTGAHRRAARRVALTRAPGYAVPLLALWVLLSCVVGALALLLLKRPRAAWAELADVAALDPVRWAAARWRTRGRRAVRRRDLRTLFVPGSVVARRVGDAVHEAVVPASAHDEGSVDHLEQADGEPVARPPATRAEEHHRSRVAALLTAPLTAAVVAAAAASALAGRSLRGDAAARLTDGVAGGELVGGRVTSSALWHGWLDGWHGAGLGGTAVAGPHLAVLAPPVWLVEHVPGLSGSASPGLAVVGLLLAVALPLAVLSAYLSAGVLTGHRWVRAAGALAWATTGVAGAAVASGRLGAVVALVLLPAVAAGLVLLARPGGTATGAFATGLGAAVLGAFAPALLVLVLALALAVVLLGHGTGPRARAGTAGVVPLVLLGPWVLDAVRDWRLLAAGPGLTSWGGGAAEPWELALLHPGGPGSGLVWAGVPLVALGLLGLARGRASRSLASGLAAVVLLALAAVLLAPRLRLSTVPVGVGGAGDPVTPWVGTAQLALALGLVAGAVLAVDALLPVRRRRSRRGLLAGAGGLLLAGGAVATAAVLAWTTFGTALGTWAEPRPAVAVEHADGEPAGRTLEVAASDAGAAYRLVGREVGAVARGLPHVGAADAALAPTVGGLLDGTDPEAAAALARDAVTTVAVDRALGADVARRLDSTSGLTPMAPRGTTSFWRVGAGDAGTSPVAPPRLRLVTGEATALVPTTGLNAATRTEVTAPARGGTLVVAQPTGWARFAEVTFRGEALRATVEGGRPAYALPAGTGT